MSLPKFNLSKLKESVAKQQAVTKEDIRNLLLLDRLQAQIASQNSLTRSGFTIKGKRLTRKDKIKRKENPDSAIYNAFVDSIVENRDFSMEFNFYEDNSYDNSILKGSDFTDSYHFFEEKLMDNFSQVYLIERGSYYEEILYIDPANNRMIQILLDQGNGNAEINASQLNTDAFYSLDNPTLENTVYTILSAFKTEKARNEFLDVLALGIFVCEVYLGFDNRQTLLFFPSTSSDGVYNFDVMKLDLDTEFSYLDEKSLEDLRNGLTILDNQFSPRVVQARDIVNIKRITDVIA